MASKASSGRSRGQVHFLNWRALPAREIVPSHLGVTAGGAMSKFSSAALLTILGLVTSGARADAVLDWNDVTLAEVTASGQLPPDGARTMAMVHVAVFDALNAIDRRYEPVALPERGPEGASTDAAVASASYTVLAALFPSREPRLAESYAAALARVPDRDAKHL